MRGRLRAHLGEQRLGTRPVARAAALRQLLRPEGKLQERVVCVAHAAALYGEGLGRSLRQGLELDPRWLQLVQVAGDDVADPALQAASAGGAAR